MEPERLDEGRLERALSWFEEQHDYYVRHARRSKFFYGAAQAIAVVLAGITPVLVVIEELPVAVRGLPAAIAAMALALSNLFQWRENWLRFTQTAGALERERLWLDTRTGPYAAVEGGATRLERFVERASMIVASEYAGWQEMLLSRASETEIPKPLLRHEEAP
jgi:hypothetical protein